VHDKRYVTLYKAIDSTNIQDGEKNCLRQKCTTDLEDIWRLERISGSEMRSEASSIT
jgi:hypothetical protein